MENRNIKPVNIVIGIKRIKEIGFRLNEHFVIKDDPEKEIKIELQHRTGFSLEHNIVNLTLRCFTFYTDNKDNILTDIEVENLFEIPEFKNYVTPDLVESFPANVWLTMISLSIGHTRALLFERVTGTLLSNLIIPILNPVEVAKAFMPKIFEPNNVEESQTSMSDVLKNTK